jgi:uncharacterized protein (DUF362 family)
MRNIFHLLRLDPEHFETPHWNPLGELISPGDHVLLKPNLIRESHLVRHEEWEQIITHPSLIRAVLDYVFIALKRSGFVTIADGPQTDSRFEEIKHRIQLESIVDFYRRKGLNVRALDLRQHHWLQKEGVTYKRLKLAGDPSGYTTIDLNELSEFTDYTLSGRFYGADYDVTDTAQYHNGRRHAYVLCRTSMDADVIINLPKMKTHKKTGVTLSLKNMVGVNGHRNCLPHHTIGTPDEKGDEFPHSSSTNKLQSRGIVLFKKMLTRCGGLGGPAARITLKAGKMVFGDTGKVVRSGNWFGNDTAWRMVLDLNKCLFYFDGNAARRKQPLKYLSIVDGIIAGEGDGPSAADAKRCGTVVAGFNPVTVDTVCATIMGFDYTRIPMVDRAWKIRDLPLAGFQPDQITCSSNIEAWDGDLKKLSSAQHFGFRPYFGWVGAIERH